MVLATVLFIITFIFVVGFMIYSITDCEDLGEYSLRLLAIVAPMGTAGGLGVLMDASCSGRPISDMLAPIIAFGGLAGILLICFIVSEIVLYVKNHRKHEKKKQQQESREVELRCRYRAMSNDASKNAEITDGRLRWYIKFCEDVIKCGIEEHEQSSLKSVCEEICKTAKKISDLINAVASRFDLGDSDVFMGLSDDVKDLYVKATKSFFKHGKIANYNWDTEKPRLTTMYKAMTMLDSSERKGQMALEILSQVSTLLTAEFSILEQTSQYQQGVANCIYASSCHKNISNKVSVNADDSLKSEEDLIKCKRVLVSMHEVLRATNLQQDSIQLLTMMTQIAADNWDKQILSYSLMYLQLLQRAVNEYERAFDKQSFEKAIRSGMNHLKAMWEQMVRDTQSIDAMEIKAELRAATNLAYLRGYMPGQFTKKPLEKPTT